MIVEKGIGRSFSTLSDSEREKILLALRVFGKQDRDRIARIYNIPQEEVERIRQNRKPHDPTIQPPRA